MLTAAMDLTEYVVGPVGDWWRSPENFQPTMLRLTSPRDGLTLVGPLRVRVSVHAENRLQLVGTSQSVFTSKELFSYVLDIPPGQMWTYPSPRAYGVQLLPSVSGVNTIASARYASTAVHAESVGTPWPADSVATISTGGSSGGDYHAAEPVGGGSVHAAEPVGSGSPPPPPPGGSSGNRPPPPPGGSSGYGPPPPPGVAGEARPPFVDPFPGSFGHIVGLGNNAGLIVVIRPAGHDACADPCISVDPDPCAPKRHKDCGCHSKPCRCHDGADDIPCDVAVESIPNLGSFFPAACEPCTPGASIGAPAARGPALLVRPANGGTVRTRYYNGMFITREDLETDQRNVRLKRALMNRAMGQGVVWGLNVGLDGEHVCVMPGYGVDCCGNDLVLTAPYRVDAGALVRDPAAAALLSKRGTQRLHLVLEYFECPEQPRPVHGDPCSPESTRCETSRIRETTRLRLAPPCEIDDSGPIKDFLKEIEALKNDPVVGPLLTPAAPAPAPTPALQVPFEVTVTVRPISNASVVLAPKVTVDPQPNRERGDLNISADAEFRITLRPRPGFQFVAGNTVEVLRQVGNTPTPVNAPFMPAASTPTEISWGNKLAAVVPQMIAVGGSEPLPAAAAYQLQNWRLRDANGIEISANFTEIQLTRVRPSDWRNTVWGQAHVNSLPANAEAGLHVQIPPTEARVIGRPPQMPCLSEACDPQGRPRFPVPPPWLHEDPTKPGQAADIKVIALAMVYSWLAMIMARDRIGTPQAVNTAQFTLALAAYRAMWKMFFGTEPDTDRYRLTDALQRLLQAWCCSLLYPGPKCLCDPHGVVIGCATVSAGQLQNVDPWGGRRWVVHYPLLAYWGQQFGITPPDAIVSKLFDFICCVAHLPAPRLTRRDAAGRPDSMLRFVEAPEVGRTSSVNLGATMLFVGDERETSEHMATLGVRTEREASLNPLDFVMRFVDTMTAAPQPAGDRPLVHYRVFGAPGLHMVAPGEPAARAAAAPPAETGRLREVVRTSFARRAERSAVPPLLADFAEDLTRNLLTRLPLQPANEGERPVVTRLADEGLTTIGGVLGRRASELHEVVLNRANAPELASLVEAGEHTARAVSKAVGDAIVAAASEGRLFARSDLRSPEVALDLTRRLEERLRAARIAADAAFLAEAIAATVPES